MGLLREYIRRVLRARTHGRAADDAVHLLKRPELGRSNGSGSLTLMAVGDCLLRRRVSALRDPDFFSLVELLRGGDCVYGNCEMVLADPAAVYKEFKEIDPHVLCEEWGKDELKFMGITLMGTANNHTMDFGDEGLISTLRNLERAGIVHAGAGLDLRKAAEPAFQETPAGRVALISCAASFFPHFAAGPARSAFKGRPGLNPLHVQYTVQLEPPLFEKLQQAQSVIHDLLGWNEIPDVFQEMEKLRTANSALFLETPIKAGEELDILTQPRAKDVDRVVRSIQAARRTAQFVIFSIHAHGMRWRAEIPDPFLPNVARTCLDAGADICLVTGPHVLRGIEVYRGKPIFYSLGNFVVHLKTKPSPLPQTGATKSGLHHQRRFWESFIPRITFAKGGEVAAIELYPVTLGFSGPASARGTPRLARGTEAKDILTCLSELSAPYGTVIEIEDQIGRVSLG